MQVRVQGRLAGTGSGAVEVLHHENLVTSAFEEHKPTCTQLRLLAKSATESNMQCMQAEELANTSGCMQGIPVKGFAGMDQSTLSMLLGIFPHGSAGSLS